MIYGTVNNAASTPGRPARARGFTLVEMMVVIAILAILTTLIVSVGTAVRNKGLEDVTHSDLKIIQAAIMTYNEQISSFPTELQIGGKHMDDKPDKQSSNLYDQLHNVAKCRDILVKLSPKCVVVVGSAEFKDAYGRAIEYYQTGGIGGTPVVVSSGQDGKFDTADDIRSDE